MADLDERLRRRIQSLAPEVDVTRDWSSVARRVRTGGRRQRARLAAAGAVLALTIGTIAIGTLEQGSEVVTLGPDTSSSSSVLDPATQHDRWTPLLALPGIPDSAGTPVAVDIGEQLFVWGQSPQVIVDVPSGATTRLPPAPIAERAQAAAAWTGTEVLIWGGEDAPADGAAYNPDAETWRVLPPAPINARVPLTGVWTGTELLVWGSTERGADADVDGAAYDPAADSWRLMADSPIAVNVGDGVWTGTHLVVVGAELSGDNAGNRAHALAYDPASDRWEELPDPELPPQAASVVWTGDALIAWEYRLEARRYRFGAPAWEVLPDIPLDQRECYPTGAATGGKVLLAFCEQAVIFDLAAVQWRPLLVPEPLEDGFPGVTEIRSVTAVDDRYVALTSAGAYLYG